MEEKRPSRTSRRRRRKINLARFIGRLLLIAVVILGGIGAGYVAAAIKTMPAWDPEKLEAAQSSIVYDYQGKEVSRLYQVENREVVKLSRIPIYLQQAFIATEDDRFYQHHGVRPEAIARAALVNLIEGYGSEGGSTITQQLVKNAFFNKPEKTLRRKIQEAILALRLERQYSKAEILEMYLNRIYFGEGAHGVQAAARVYFGKNVENLTLSESALLTGLAKSPATYSPFKHPEAAKDRRAVVLDRMAECQFITPEQAEKAKNEPLGVVAKKTSAGSAPANSGNTYQYFLDCVIEEASRILEEEGLYDNPQLALYQEGLRIYTTMDSDLQRYTEELYSQDKNFPPGKGDQIVQSAAVVIDPKSGGIRTIVGGRNYTLKRGFNRATDAKRQPGSAFKPIAVYAPALVKGFTPGTVLDDVPVSYKIGSDIWSPSNYDGVYRGPITMREAIKRSVNVYAVKMLELIGVSEGIRFAENLGISTLVKQGTKNDNNLSLALGGLTYGVTPLEMAGAYAAFANQGIYIKPYAIEKIEDQNRRVLYQHKSQQQIVMDPRSAYLLTSMLQSVVTSEGGTGQRAYFGRPAAGKTGTTSDDTNAWFAGYTPDLAAVVWMGYDNQSQSMRSVYGGNYPAPLWKAIMQKAHEKIPPHDFTSPGGIVSVTICTRSGKLPGPACPAEELATELFPEEAVPTQTCDRHVLAEVCAESGKLATPYCPARITRSFIKPAPGTGAGYSFPGQLPSETCPLHSGGPFTPQSSTLTEESYEGEYNEGSGSSREGYGRETENNRQNRNGHNRNSPLMPRLNQ